MPAGHSTALHVNCKQGVHISLIKARPIKQESRPEHRCFINPLLDTLQGDTQRLKSVKSCLFQQRNTYIRELSLRSGGEPAHDDDDDSRAGVGHIFSPGVSWAAAHSVRACPVFLDVNILIILFIYLFVLFYLFNYLWFV